MSEDGLIWANCHRGNPPPKGETPRHKQRCAECGERLALDMPHPDACFSKYKILKCLNIKCPAYCRPVRYIKIYSNHRVVKINAFGREVWEVP